MVTKKFIILHRPIFYFTLPFPIFEEKIMAEELYRPIPKKISFPKNSLIIHPIAEPAFRIWFEFFDKKNLQNQGCIEGFYQINPKLMSIEKTNQYLFFENFVFIHYLTSLHQKPPIYALIIPESTENIEKCAWQEVMQLPFQSDINHEAFFQRVSSTAPKTILKKLLGVERFDKKRYLAFYRLNKDVFTYHRKKIKSVERQRLPSIADWIKDS